VRSKSLQIPVNKYHSTITIQTHARTQAHSETHILHTTDGGAEVIHENFALRDVSPRLLDTQSLHVVVMLVIDGPAVLVANASEDVRRGPLDIPCKQHQFLMVSDELWLPSTPVIVSRHGYGYTHTS